MLLQLSKEHLIHGGLNENDVFFQYTTPGWMMWNFLVGAMVAGCPLVLYEGSPLKPASVLWDLAAKYGITVFGTSAAYLGALQRSGYIPKAALGDKLKVRQVLSTGSPLRAELYPWIIENVGPVLIGSITGGTDICSLFAGHNEALPVRAGELQARNLGMNVDVVDQDGKSVPRGGEGDLVCKSPFPVQPLGFWGQDEKRYFESYYATIPGVWYHGDHVSLTLNGGLVMLGRSDAVLNPGGIRFGSSEIYEVLEANKHVHPLDTIESSVAAALKLPTGDDEVVVLLLVLQSDCQAAKEGKAFEELVKSVKDVVRSQRSARHVPRFVRRVQNVPLTLNGKLSEVPVKKLLNGASLSSVNSSTLQNPAVLEEYVEIGQELRRELQGSSA
ncbi:probable acetoacetyl-synthetase [Ceraceosorus bombacis]|uniref:Probable acetoacetyl-synthetase n=1 Tax=Ceraceosorus bombacis TaxID=401625 RepID=A0A0P1BBD0_9BASI|nr:probable acetoacetyl-synthetase [Ceraceosorus bombacis]